MKTGRQKIEGTAIKELETIYKEELGFLLNLKSSIGGLNNRIHDVLAALAIENLRERFPDFEFKYTNAGASGIDIEAYKGSKRTLVAEVKTTMPSKQGHLRGPQEGAIKADLERLKQQGVRYKFLVLLSSRVKEVIKRKYKRQYPDIELLDALGKES